MPIKLAKIGTSMQVPITHGIHIRALERDKRQQNGHYRLDYFLQCFNRVPEPPGSLT